MSAQLDMANEALESKVVRCCETCDSFITEPYTADMNMDGHCPFHSCEKKKTDSCDKWNIETLPEQALKEQKKGR